MRGWRFLKPGDRVFLISPGYPSSEGEVQGAVDFLKKWDLEPVLPKGTIKPHYFHANTDERRIALAKEAFTSDVKAVWCLRGGYGSAKLLPALAKLKKPAQTKLLIGISDITSLHSFVTQEWGWVSLHAPLLDRLGRNLVLPKHERELKKLLFGETVEVEFSGLRPLNEQARQSSTIRGKLTGGNLAVIQSGLATPWQIQTRGKILFLEDIGERGYRVDRMLEQLYQAGLLKGLKALVFGDFIGGEEPHNGKNRTGEAIQHWAKKLSLPVYSGLPAGHAKVQRPVFFNTPAILTLDGKRARLLVQSGGKR